MSSDNETTNYSIQPENPGCGLYWPGHNTHRLQARKSRGDNGILVEVHVEPWFGTVQLISDGSVELYWHHNAAQIVETLQRSYSLAMWHPQFQLLVIEDVTGAGCFNLAKAEQASSCRDNGASTAEGI